MAFYTGPLIKKSYNNMNKIVFKLHTLAKPKITSANKGKLQEEVVIITANLRGFKTCGAKKNQLYKP